MFWKQWPTLYKIPSVVSNKHQGLEHHSPAESEIWAQYSACFGKTLGSGIRQKLGTDAGLGMKTDGILESDERVSEGGIVVNNGAGILYQNLFSRS